MTSEAKNLPGSIVDQLDSIEGRKNGELHDVAFLDEIREGMQELLRASDGDDSLIRRLLHERQEQGEMRKETYELVTSLLDQVRTEQLPTDSLPPSPAEADADLVPDPDDEFASTAVIETADTAPQKPEQRLQVGSVLRDRFLLKERVSGGSMGVVYKALDRRLAEAGEDQAHVAIKVLSPALAKDARALRALQQEASKGRCLTHSHIVRFIDLDRDDDLYFIVMEWLVGENLADLLDRGEPMPPERALKITQQIGLAVDYAHRCGIVHADIKPGNVMIMPTGDAKLFDFGIARARQKRESGADKTQELGAMTPAYSSMQVLTGEEPVPQDDVFSLACLYYRLVAGYRVFGPRNAAEAAEEGMSPQPLPALSDAQWRALRKALSFARVTRYPSVREFLDALETDGEVEPIAVDRLRDDDMESAIGGKSRAPLIVSGLALAALAAAFFGGYLDAYLGDAPARIVASPDASADSPEPRASDPDAGVVTGQGTASRGDMPTVAPPATARGSSAAEIDADESANGSRDASVSRETPGLEPTSRAPVADAPQLPPADIEVSIDANSPGTAAMTLNEGQGEKQVDLLRSTGIDREQRFTISETFFSSGRSPLDSGEITVRPATEVVFPPGAERARVVIAMRNDPLREADQRATLALLGAAGETVAELELSLRDDDQRQFEASIPVNTVAFAAGQVSVDERDAAVQIEIVRYRPDNQVMRVAFTASDITATAGKDYFPPAINIVEFAPGQRTARILVPLVQDSEPESNEAFVVDLVNGNTIQEPDIYQRVAVMIRDDD